MHLILPKVKDPEDFETSMSMMKCPESGQPTNQYLDPFLKYCLMNPTTLGYCYMLINPEECGYHLILSKSQVLNL